MGWYATEEADQMGQPNRDSGVTRSRKKSDMSNLRFLFSLLCVWPLLTADARTLMAPRISEPSDKITSEFPAGVAWWGTWQGALTEAKRSGKPILLLSAAPQCHGVPGIW